MSRDESADAELARLADGSLPDERAEALRARIAAAPELRARLREQERAVALTRATAELTAPDSLHAAVARRTRARGSRAGSVRARPRRRWAAASFAAGAIAAVLLAVVLLTGGAGGPSVVRTARLAAFAAPTHAAPPVDAADGDRLGLRVGTIAFPAYERRADWRAVGSRSDSVDSRRVLTVFYDVGGRRAGYSIVAGSPLPVPRGRARTIDGVRYVTRPVGSAELVTWRRDGHTCIIAGRRIARRTLLELAAASHV